MAALKTSKSKKKTKIIIFDTTLRDAEQCPGASMTGEEKLKVAHQLARLGVDVIEAGFPYSSPGDFEAVRAIVRKVNGPVIAGLARCRPEDIDRTAEALKGSRRVRIHTFIGTSPMHREGILRKTKEEVLEMAVSSVSRARGYLEDIEFSAMDATRTEFDYLCEVVEKTIDAGATIINIPDTVGYALPWEFGDLIKRLRESVPNIDQRGHQRALPRRPGPGHGQLAGRGRERRHPGGMHHQRPGRAGGQRRAGGSGGGDRHAARAATSVHHRYQPEGDLPQQPTGAGCHRHGGATE